jgi:hypothetical protein
MRIIGTERNKPMLISVSPKLAQLASFIICMPADTPSIYTDNEYGPCSVCGSEVMFRPDVPRSLPKFCLQCAEIVFRNEERKHCIEERKRVAELRRLEQEEE